MKGLEMIKQENEELRKKAELNKIVPMLISCEEDKQKLKSIPHIGDHRPTIEWELMNTYFVDSSGLGNEGEPALTYTQFIERVKVGFGYAIVEAGQFQVHIGEFRKVESINRG